MMRALPETLVARVLERIEDDGRVNAGRKAGIVRCLTDTSSDAHILLCALLSVVYDIVEESVGGGR